MGRRRRKVVKIPKKHLPKIFYCPSCGKETVGVVMSHSSVRVRCSSCGLQREFNRGKVYQQIDYFNMFTDDFYKSLSKPSTPQMKAEVHPQQPAPAPGSTG